ncbi:MAG: hypothetical protein MZU91_11305 [Desulfosudis oleivorans]|nr:hypothetical protein [Desulfosudis oleivorans]
MSFTETFLNGEQGAVQAGHAHADAEDDPAFRRRRPRLLRLRGHRRHDHADLRGDADPGRADGPVLRHHDGPPAGGHLRIDLLDRVRRLPLPRAVPDEEAALEHPARELDVRAARRRHLHVLVRRVPVRLRAALHALLAPARPTSRSSALWGGTFFIVGIAIVMVGVVFFVVNIFKTITYTPAGWAQQPAGALLGSALGLSGIGSVLHEEEERAPGVAAGGRHRPRHGRHGAQRRDHPVHRRPDPGLHGRRDLRHEPEAQRRSTPCSTRTGSGGASTSSPTAWS